MLLTFALCSFGSVLGAFLLFLMVLKTNRGIQRHWFAWVYQALKKVSTVDAVFDRVRYPLFKKMTDIKSGDPELLASGQFRLLEIGVGPGANFHHYPNNARVSTIDPNGFMENYMQDSLSRLPKGAVFERHLVTGAEDLGGFDDESFDVVVSTHVLCSVTDVSRALREVYRVLRKVSH